MGAQQGDKKEKTSVRDRMEAARWQNKHAEIKRERTL